MYELWIYGLALVFTPSTTTRGILSAGIGESLRLGMRAEFFRSETTFSRSEPLFSPPFPQIWQKQCCDFHRYGHFCLKVPEEFLPFLSQAQCSDLWPSYWLTLLVWQPQHPMRIWCFIQRKVPLISSSQDKSYSNWRDAASGKAME